MFVNKDVDNFRQLLKGDRTGLPCRNKSEQKSSSHKRKICNAIMCDTKKTEDHFLL